MHAEVWSGIRTGYESDRLAHAYVIVGSPRGSALHFAESFLKLLFCESADRPCNACPACRRIDAHTHVDTMWLEPQSKARQIKAEQVRDLVHRIGQTSFEGGWKAGIILSADCMNTNSANALLKTLEEPPPKTLLLLVTDSPQALLPTIISRCQKIVLENGSASQGAALWQGSLMEILHDLPPAGGLAAARLASQLKGLFDTVRDGIEVEVEDDLGQGGEVLDESKLKEILSARINARLKEVQSDVFRVILDWQRDVLLLTNGIDAQNLIFSAEHAVLAKQAKLHTPGSALQSIAVVEDMARRTNRNIPDLQVFDEAFRKLVR